MISKKEVCAKRLGLLMTEVTDAEFLALSSAETLIDCTIKETLTHKAHGIPLAKIIACFGCDCEAVSRRLLQALLCKYETMGWEINLNDDYLILE